MSKKLLFVAASALALMTVPAFAHEGSTINAQVPVAVDGSQAANAGAVNNRDSNNSLKVSLTSTRNSTEAEKGGIIAGGNVARDSGNTSTKNSYNQLTSNRSNVEAENGSQLTSTGNNTAADAKDGGQATNNGSNYKDSGNSQSGNSSSFNTHTSWRMDNSAHMNTEVENNDIALNAKNIGGFGTGAISGNIHDLNGVNVASQNSGVQSAATGLNAVQANVGTLSFQ